MTDSKILFKNQKEFREMVSRYLDTEQWELLPEITPEFVIDSICEQMGISGLPGDEPGEVVEFENSDVEEVSCEVATFFILEYFDLDSMEVLTAHLRKNINGVEVEPVRLTTGISMAGLLIRDCFRISHETLTSESTIYVREIDEYDGIIDRTSGGNSDGW